MVGCVFQPCTMKSRGAGGFTLVEAALATVIVGVAFVAMLQLFASCTRQNVFAADLTTALTLAQQVQERMAGLAFNDPEMGRGSFGAETGETLGDYDDVDDYDGQRFTPPIDAMGTPIERLARYTQTISVMPVRPQKLSANADESSPEIGKTTYTGAVRVRVRVLRTDAGAKAAEEVYRTSWICLDR